MLPAAQHLPLLGSGVRKSKGCTRSPPVVPRQGGSQADSNNFRAEPKSWGAFPPQPLPDTEND